MRICLDSLSEIPYLEDSVLNEHANIKIFSEDNEEFQISQLMLFSWIRLGKVKKSTEDDTTVVKAIKDHFDKYQDVIISSNFNQADLKTICDFVMKGILSRSEFDSNGEISNYAANLFHSFGIDLKYIMNTHMTDLSMFDAGNEDDHGINDEMEIKSENENMSDNEIESENETVSENENISRKYNVAEKENVSENDKQETDYISRKRSIPSKNDTEIDQEEPNVTEQTLDVVEKESEQSNDQIQDDSIQSRIDRIIRENEKIIEDSYIPTEDIIEQSYSPTKKSTYKCYDCEKSWEDKENYEFHIKWKSCVELRKNTPPPAKKLKQTSETKQNVQKDSEVHKFVHLNDKDQASSVLSYMKTKGYFICPTCCHMFDSQEKLNDHQSIHKLSFSCNDCDKTFATRMDLTLHKVSHNEEKKQLYIAQSPRSVKCDKCEEKFLNLPLLESHLRKKHGLSEFPCDTCGKTFVFIQDLVKHKKYHDKGPCADCGILLPKCRMQDHIKSVHTKDEDKAFKCHLCPKAYGMKHALNQHMYVHTGERPHVCQYCGDTFNDQSNLRQHETSVHLGIKRKNRKKREATAVKNDEKQTEVPKKPKGRPKKKTSE